MAFEIGQSQRRAASNLHVARAGRKRGLEEVRDAADDNGLAVAERAGRGQHASRRHEVTTLSFGSESEM
jgi:hypothetical protein